MSSLRRPPAAQRNSYYSIEGYLDDYSPEIVRANTLGQKLDGLFKRRKTNLADIQRRSIRKQRPWTPFLDYLWDRRYFLRALLPITAALLETFLLLFLFCVYFTLPADPVTGEKPPRIAGLYATFPFISCVGSQRLAVYQVLTFCVVVIGIVSTAITFYFTRDDLIGWQTRRAGWLANVSGAGLSIWVVFAAATPDRHLHLTVTAVKAITVFGIKTAGMLVDHYDRSNYPGLRKTGVIQVLKWWRIMTLVIAFPLAVMQNVAIFSCTHASLKDIQTPGTNCHRIMSLGAPADWLYALTTISWILASAFDIYTTPIVSKVKSQQDQAEFKLLSRTETSEWHDSTAHRQHGDLETRTFTAPERDEEAETSDSSRSSVDEIEKKMRRMSAYDKLDMKPEDAEDEDEHDLGMQRNPRHWA